MERNGTTYPANVPLGAVLALERARASRTRLKITHRTPDGEWISVGYIGRSMGPVKAALVIHNRRSFGGLMLYGSIVKIEHSNRQDGGVLWEAES